MYKKGWKKWGEDSKSCKGDIKMWLAFLCDFHFFFFFFFFYGLLFLSCSINSIIVTYYFPTSRYAHLAAYNPDSGSHLIDLVVVDGCCVRRT